MVLVLSACSVPVHRTFPNLPKTLTQECPDLQFVPVGTTKLSEILIVVTTNYSHYHQCRFKVESFQEWHKQQKEIFESVK
jgi:hypothetical protein